jgi:lysozyme family protein
MNFDTAFDRLLGHEGTYSNDPADPGGETMWGISKRAYPDLDIAHLTRDEAKFIYLRDFWQKIHANELPGAVAFQVFDFAVNSGIGTAVRYLQRALKVADDGYWGPITRAAVTQTNETDLLLRFNALRLDFYTRLSTWPSFGKGWARRIAQNLLYAADDT